MTNQLSLTPAPCRCRKPITFEHRDGRVTCVRCRRHTDFKQSNDKKESHR